VRYDLTEEQFQRVMAASQPVPMIMLQCGTPRSQQENANAAWQAVALELGCKWDTIAPYIGGGARAITAEPLEPTT